MPIPGNNLRDNRFMSPQFAMREKIARALEPFDRDLALLTEAEIAERRPCSPQMDMADAVLAAMREPTEGMVGAGDDALSSDCRAECDADKVWRAMIDAA